MSHTASIYFACSTPDLWELKTGELPLAEAAADCFIAAKTRLLFQTTRYFYKNLKKGINTTHEIETTSGKTSIGNLVQISTGLDGITLKVSTGK